VSHFLLEYPTFDFRGADESGRTVLHKVCGMNASDDVYASSVEILRMLLSREGLDINQQDNSGETPLHFACRSCEPHRLRLLLSYPGIDPKVLDNYGRMAHQSISTNSYYSRNSNESLRMSVQLFFCVLPHLSDGDLETWKKNMNNNSLNSLFQEYQQNPSETSFKYREKLNFCKSTLYFLRRLLKFQRYLL